jgi:hypothetical protein
MKLSNDHVQISHLMSQISKINLESLDNKLLTWDYFKALQDALASLLKSHMKSIQIIESELTKSKA